MSYIFFSSLLNPLSLNSLPPRPSSTMVATSTSPMIRLKARLTSTKCPTRGVLKQRRQRQKDTGAEKADRKKRNAEKGAVFIQALDEAQETVHMAAVQMQAKVPGHVLAYYVKVILQAVTSSRVSKRPKVSMWNAFLSQETRHHNSGTLFSVSV